MQHAMQDDFCKTGNHSQQTQAWEWFQDFGFRMSAQVSDHSSVSEVEICNYAYEGRLQLLIAVLDKNPALLGKRDSNERTALHWACSSGHAEIVSYLLDKGAKVSADSLLDSDMTLY